MNAYRIEPYKVDILKSTKKGKKLMAIFYDENNDKIKIIHFGAAGFSDFTIHKDEKRKQRYIERHKVKEKWNDPMTAGSLAVHILWNKKTLKSSIKDFKKKFNL